MKARVSYLTISKRKNLSLPLKDETDQFVTCLVLPECLSVKIASDSEANRNGADAESSVPLFFSFSASFKNSSPREIVFVLGLVGRVSVSIHYCREISEYFPPRSQWPLARKTNFWQSDLLTPSACTIEIWSTRTLLNLIAWLG